MDARGNIYELSEKEKATLQAYFESKDSTRLKEMRIAEDVGRLDGYLRGRAESDRRKHEKLVHDSKKQGTYRKNK